MENAATPLLPHLEAAARAAAESLSHCHGLRDAIVCALREYRREVRKQPLASRTTPKRVASDGEAFETGVRELQETVAHLVARFSAELKQRYDELERDARFITVMLFGKTRAGKSTTMEALLFGRGDSIGSGRQHTTRDVREYVWPAVADSANCTRPAVRVIDTPGIEGFKGEALAVMAAEHIQRADHVLFLMTDDKQSANELEYFRNIETAGKGVTVLLNVKCKDSLLHDLVDDPEGVFAAAEIEGHVRRIAGYLSRNHGIDRPEVIPFHARAAHLARHPDNSPPAGLSRDALYRCSRLHDVEQRLARFVREESEPARIRAPYDLLRSYADRVQAEADRCLAWLAVRQESLRAQSGAVATATLQVQRSCNREIEATRKTFIAAEHRLAALVDDVLESGVGIRGLNGRLQKLLHETGAHDAVKHFVEFAQKECGARFGEQVRKARYSEATPDATAFQNALDALHEAKRAKASRRQGAVVAKAGAGAGAALGGWALLNWWNPTGAAAAVGWLTIGVVGLAVDATVSTVTDEWEATSKRELAARHRELVTQLKAALRRQADAAAAECRRVLDAMVATYMDSFAAWHTHAESETTRLQHLTQHLRRQVDRIVGRADVEVYRRLAAAVIPEVANELVTIERVSRVPGRNAKVVVRASHLSDVEATTACEGPGDAHSVRLGKLFGGEAITFIDAEARATTKVCQALRPLGIDARGVTVRRTAAGQVATARIPANCPENDRVAEEVRLAENATGILIHLHRS